MKSLPRIASTLFLIPVLLFSSAGSLYAASAYISPATGLITNSSFKVSVYVESLDTEPEIAGAEIKISYPANVSVVSITNGEFDSYLEKTYDPATRIITVNALNNAGNYKTGKVKVASIDLETTANTGDVQLSILSESGISGSGGEQLLTETINGVYSIEIAATGDTTTDTSDTTTTTTTTTTEVPETGKNDVFIFLAVSLALVALGGLTFFNPLSKRV